MGLRDYVKLGLAALVGAGITYAAIDKDVVPAVGTPTTAQCETVYETELSELGQKYEGLQTPPGVAGIKDLNIDLVVSPETGFFGYIFEDKASGEHGVITKSEFLGKNSYNMTYTNLESVLQKSEKATAEGGVSVYSSETEDVTKK